MATLRPASRCMTTNARYSVLADSMLTRGKERLEIECRRAYVRNAEFGNSAIVDSRRRLVPAIQAYVHDGRTILIGRVPINLGRSIACVFTVVMLTLSLQDSLGQGRQRPALAGWFGVTSSATASIGPGILMCLY
jgi:hypothetical protein